MIGSDMTVDSKWRRLLSWLRREFPVARSVTARRVKIANREKAAGDTEQRGQRFLIRIDRRLAWGRQRDTLLHEWAHCRTWHGTDTDDHGPEWSLQHGTLYREFVAWNYGRRPKD